MEYDTFLLEVHRDGEIRAELTPAGQDEGERKEGRLGLTERERQFVQDAIDRLQRAELDEKGLQLLGDSLYDDLFPGEVGSLFSEAVEKVRKDPNRRLRVWIDVDPDCRAVAEWPLEFLRCAAHGGWLATQKQLITLSRRLTFHGYKYSIERHALPLRILVIVSKPPALGGVMTSVIEDIAKWAAIEEPVPPSEPKVTGRPQAAWEAGPRPASLEVRLLGLIESYEQATGVTHINQPATFLNIGQEVDGWRPDVVHFIGHGKFEEGQGCLALMPDPSAEDVEAPYWCNADEFAQLFTGWHPLMVVLQACEGAATEGGPGFTSVAAQLVKQSIPAIVAMQFAIRNDCASVFAAGFYQALAHGLEIDAAVQHGRWKIAYTSPVRWKERHFGTPALFMLRPGRIIETMSPAGPEMPQRQPQPSSASLPANPESQRAAFLLKKASEAAAEGYLEEARQWSEEAAALMGGQKAASGLDQTKQQPGPAVSAKLTGPDD